MWSNFVCLVASVYLDDEERDALSDVALTMATKNRAAQKVKTSRMEGRVTTRFDHAVLGGISGMVFEAEVETDRGRGKVRYIMKIDVAVEVRERNLKTRWVKTSPSDSRHPSENAHLN